MKHTYITKLMAAALCCGFATSLSARQLFLSPTGNDNNAGTKDQPYATLAKAVSEVRAGDTCYVRGGTYKTGTTVTVTNSGSKDARICLFAYPGETPVFDFSAMADDAANRGINHNIGANYWHYRGLTFANAGDNGMKMEGSFCVLENCTFHSNHDTGLQMGFGKSETGENTRNPNFEYGRYNIILNCDSYDNVDTRSNGGDADGFALKLFPGPGNEYHGCRSWYNSDDGWDFYYVYFPVVVDNCWTMNNGRVQGNGNGFKMGGGKQGGEMSHGAHVYSNCISMNNPSKGFDQNNHEEGCYMFNCLSVGNGINYGFKNATTKYGKWVLRNCVGFNGKTRNHQFNAGNVDAEYCSWMVFDHCAAVDDRDKSANGGKTPVIADYTDQYVSLSYDDAIAARQADGSLPAKFGRLVSGSKFIDAGTIIKDFQTVNESNPAYALKVTIPYEGKSADMGPFEHGMDKMAYTLVLPSNDGSTPDADTTHKADTTKTDSTKADSSKTDAGWYPFQSSTLPDSMSFLTYNKASINPAYAGKSTVTYTGSTGALAISAGGYAQFTLNSLSKLQAKIYITGGRTLTIRYQKAGDSKWTESSLSKSKGSYTIDLASLTSTTSGAITIQLVNDSTNSGDINITDLLYKVAANQTGIIEVTNNVDMYQTETGVIVYGDVAELYLVNAYGQVAAHASNMQFINTTGVSNGMYVMVVKGRNGKMVAKKIIIRH